MTVLRNSKAPNLPISPTEFNQGYAESLTNTLRLYFNEVDNITGALLSLNGGRYLSLPHISASDTTDQYATGDNIPTVVKWNTLESNSGFTLNPPGSATCLVPGTYKIDYSLQLVNTDNAAHDATFWLKKNNIDVARSASKFTIPARKSAGVPSYIIAYSSASFTIENDDVIELYWATEKAYSTTGPVDGVYMEYLPAQTVPYPHPEIPSAIGAITFVSRLP